MASKKYKTVVKVRIDPIGREETGRDRGDLAMAIARRLEELGLTLHSKLEITVIERTGSLQGKRTTVTIPKHKRR